MINNNILSMHILGERNQVVGTERAIREAISPQGILEHISYIFTCAAKHQNLMELNKSFTLAMADSLGQESTAANGYQIPATLVVEFLECTVIFTLPEAKDREKLVSIEVHKGYLSARDWINKTIFCRLCAAIQIRQRFNLPVSSITLTHYKRIELCGVDLCNADLRGVDLSNTDLSSADLRGANLYQAKLHNAVLNEADLRGANLYQAKLHNAVLNEADMRWAQLEEGDFSCKSLFSTDLAHADMINANLYRARLYEVCLRYANLNGANFEEAYLIDTDLTEANLSLIRLLNAHLENSNLSAVNLEGADLNGARVVSTKLCGANLRRVFFMNTYMSKVDLSGARLTGAHFENTCLRYTNLSNADLSGARLSGVNVIGANFYGADLSNICIEGPLLKLPTWNKELLNIYLSDIDNNRTLLTMLDSIDDRYADVKLRMARELMFSLQEIDVSCVALCLLNALSKSPYIGDAAINTWLDTIGEQYLNRFNLRVMALTKKSEKISAAALFKLFKLFSRQPERMFSLNGAFIQLIAHAKNAEDEVLSGSAARLYNVYLQQDRVKPFAALDDFGDYGTCTGRPDWKDSQAANYILFPPQAEEPVMLVSARSLLGMLKPDPKSPLWDRFFLYNRQAENLPLAQYSLQTLFQRHFRLFYEPYRLASAKANFIKLLETLQLGDMRALFISATHSASSKKKLVNPKDQIKLGEILSLKLVYSKHRRHFSLTREHCGEIFTAYGICSVSDTEKAQVLLCLAAVFTKYSTSAMFGDEDDSPEMLRHYAYALMEQAHVLDRQIFNSEEGRDRFEDWVNRLLGLWSAFNCSSILFMYMVDHIRRQFPDVLASIMPPAWS